MFCYFQLKLGDERLKIVTLLTLCALCHWSLSFSLNIGENPVKYHHLPCLYTLPGHPLLVTVRGKILRWMDLTMAAVIFFMFF